ncbi:hypothetical protein CPB83DRAFT_25456 [Crepidotus variabilis]|uniref:Uncharacterized protein n=1 Tax=Crepidotus variabilis TaxID=179855 RepID=A0A9P6ET23_9AGAR|nr:hypothetical protein CPB83DRAFT_25456 [Crepidotus variabilis]
MPDPLICNGVQALTSSSRYHSIYFGLHIAGGFVGLPLLALTLILCGRIPRQPYLVNFCFTWTLFSISYTLTSLTGLGTRCPPIHLCVAQAAMIDAAPPMVTVAALQLILKIWQTFRDPSGQIGCEILRPLSSVFKTAIYLALPYVTYGVFVILALTLLNPQPENLLWRVGFFCQPVHVASLSLSSLIFCMLVIFIILCFELLIGVQYLRSRRRITTSFPLAEKSISLGLLIRLFIFNVYTVVSFSTCIVSVSARKKCNWDWWVVLLASFPLATCIVIVLQKNVWVALCLARHNKDESHETSNVELPSARRVVSNSSLNDVPSIDSNKTRRTFT